MTQSDLSAPGLPIESSRITSPESPHADGHDEWRLDEALAETFPASDSIAATPIRVSRAVASAASQKVEVATHGSDGSTGVEIDAEAEALETPMECQHCHNSIAATVALNFEGADYVYHFCGPQCFSAWRTTAIVHDE